MKPFLQALACITSLHLACISTSAAASAGLGSAVPAVLDGVQNLNFSTSDTTNTAVQYVPSNYVAGDNAAALGQTFTTGSNAGGYTLSAVSVRQVSWGTTFWDYTGGTVTLQIFKLDSTSGGVGNITQLALETATIGGEPDGITLSSGSPGANARWLTVTLDAPLPLAPDTMYGFQITSNGTGGNDQFFMQVDGTSTDSYAGGFALGTNKVSGLPDSNYVWDGNNGQPSDRAFVATMSGLTGPTPPVFISQPQNQSCNVGETVTLTASAIGYPPPAYHWEYSPDGVAAFVDVTDGGSTSGATTSMITISPAGLGHTGFYRAVADNGMSATSNPAQVMLANRAESFPIERVRLLDSRFKTNQELHRTGYLAWIDPERLLYPFRENTGLPQTPGATSLGGWEGGGGFTAVRGHMAGHYLTAASKMYAATGDAAFLAKVNHLVSKLKECQDVLGASEEAAGRPYGYLSAFPISYFETLERTPAWPYFVPFYTIHKILAGLVDAHIHCGNQQALDMAIAMSDYHRWRVNQLTPSQVEAMFRTDNGNSEEWGGMNETLSEIYRLSAARGDMDPARHLEFARIFHRDWFITPLSNNNDRLSGLHANTHIPQVVGFARTASLLAPSDPERVRLYNAAENFWNIVLRDHSFVIGGNSFSELFGTPGQETGTGGSALDIGTSETCNTYNMLKLTKELFKRGPSARYADYYEHALYNHILASLAPDTGMPTYYMSLASGTFKTYSKPEGSCWCCTGSGIENTSRYNEAIYFHRGDELWVNLFIPSVLDWQENGMTLTLETGFPESDQITLGIGCHTPTEATLHLRVPSWIAGTPELKINGVAQAVTAAPGSYLSLTRTWQDGDSLAFTLPMELRVDRSRDDSSQASILYGPLVMAGDLGTEHMPALDQAGGDPWEFRDVPRVEAPSLVGRDSALPGEWVRSTSEPLVFTTTAAFAGGAERRSVTLKPFYDIHHTRYSVYWNLMEPEALSKWIGAGESSDWSAAANWDVAPADGWGLEFSASTGGALSNDLTAGTRVGGLGFPPSAGSFVLGGYGITLEGDVINNSAFSQRLDMPVALSDGNTWLFDAGASGLILDGPVTGPGGMMKRGAGDLTVASELSLQRGIEVLEGDLHIGAGGSLGAPYVNLAEGARLVINRGSDTTLATAVRGGGSLVKRGAGALQLTSPATHTGPTVVEQGTLRLGSREAPALLHRWSFNGDLNDSAGSSNAKLVDVGANNASLASTAVTLAGGTRGASDYISLGSGLLPEDGSPVTVELWATQHSFVAWSRIFDVGASDSENLFMAWTRDSASTDRVEWRDSSATTRSDESVAPYVAGTEYHILISIEPGAGLGGTTRVTWHAAPATASSLGAARGSFDTPNTMAALNDADFWLGRSHYGADATANASYNEVRIWNRVFGETELDDLHFLGPDNLGTHDAQTITITGSLPNEAVLELGNAGIFDAASHHVELRTLTGGAGGRFILSGGTLVLKTSAVDPGASFAGSFSGTGTIVNHGVLRLVGDHPWPAGVALVNHGLLDIMTWKGALPAGFVNDGTVLDSRALKIDGIQKESSGVRLRFKTYRGHQYRVQSAVDLDEASWQDTGVVLEGATGDTVEPFIPMDSGAIRRFWRLAVTP